MSSYKELLAQREKLEKQIEEAKSREYAEVLNEIKQKMADYGITLAELGGGRAAKGGAKAARPRAGVDRGEDRLAGRPVLIGRAQRQHHLVGIELGRAGRGGPVDLERARCVALDARA